ncbi:MAG TPA: ABC transporter ATP-binding protein [Actinomycetota bacterium]|nr:ABC transporter ATP-binding protein [Actinomycetota bacterium]
MSLPPVIGIERLTKQFGEVTAVNDVSLTVEAGEVMGYLGPNGAGKTTTIRCLLGFVFPTSGRVSLFGKEVLTSREELLSEVGYLPGEFGMWPNLTGRQVLEYLGSIHARPPTRREELCAHFEMTDRDLDRQIRFYSRGMKQKIGLIQAFQHDPLLAILDEPTEGLDPVMKERFLELLVGHRERGGTALLSSHILSEVELATDRVAIIKRGQLIKLGETTELTGERVRHCELELREPAPLGLSRVPGVSNVMVNGPRYRFDVTGDMGPLLRWIAPANPLDFVAEPVSLSEAFFEIFEEDQA